LPKYGGKSNFKHTNLIVIKQDKIHNLHVDINRVYCPEIEVFQN